MFESLTKKFRPEKGQVVIFTVLLLPLILGVVVLVIELGNIYVHYSELQNVADTAAITGNISSAKEVVKANFVNSLRKETIVGEESNENFAVMIYKGTRLGVVNDEKFYLKLRKNIPMMFIKVFGERMSVDAYAVSKDNALTHFTADPTSDEKFDWGKPLSAESGIDEP